MNKKLNTELDLETFRNPNDTQKEWRLKSQFILKFQNKFDPERLACLAQCYVNIETMGCRLVIKRKYMKHFR